MSPVRARNAAGTERLRKPKSFEFCPLIGSSLPRIDKKLYVLFLPHESVGRSVVRAASDDFASHASSDRAEDHFEICRVPPLMGQAAPSRSLDTPALLIAPAHHAQQIAIIIGPRDGPGRGGKRFRAFYHLLAGERSGIARKQDPVGLRERALGNERIDAHGLKAEIAANSGEHGP